MKANLKQLIEISDKAKNIAEEIVSLENQIVPNEKVSEWTENHDNKIKEFKIAAQAYADFLNSAFRSTLTSERVMYHMIREANYK